MKHTKYREELPTLRLITPFKTVETLFNSCKKCTIRKRNVL